jgi:NAD(P)-dependent dehydrogenase (short-subunit alcohol dehydrogenase family)
MASTILITGASSGIGKATAEYFAERDWNVAATMRKPADGKELAGRANVLVTALDLLDPASIGAAVDAMQERFGGVDALLNNAGYGAYGPLEATSMEVVRRQFEVNVFGLIATIKAVLPGMRARGSGTIVNVASAGGRVAYPLGTLYHGSKWAVEGLSEALHYELAALGIRVRIIEPGGVQTDFSGRSFVFTNDPELADYQPLVEGFASASESPTGQMAPEEVAEVIWEAVTDESPRLRYICGEGAQKLLGRRFSAEQDEAFVAGMRRLFGL